MDIFIAWNDDPTNAERVRFEEWSDFFEYVSDVNEIDARVMWGVQVDPEDKGYEAKIIPTSYILEMYRAWQQNAADDARHNRSLGPGQV